MLLVVVATFVFGCSNISRGESDHSHESVNAPSRYTVCVRARLSVCTCFCVCVFVAGCGADRGGAGGGAEPQDGPIQTVEVFKVVPLLTSPEGGRTRSLQDGVVKT